MNILCLNGLLYFKLHDLSWIASNGAGFHLKHMSFLDRFVAAFSLASDLSWHLSCPLHCGSSVAPFLGLGLSVGLLLGFLAGIWVCHLFILIPRCPDPATHYPASHPDPPRPHSQTEGRRARHRLGAYLVDAQRAVPGGR